MRQAVDPWAINLFILRHCFSIVDNHTVDLLFYMTVHRLNRQCVEAISS